MTYTWYALMGGFCLPTSSLHNTLSTGILRPPGILFLAQHGHFLRISDEEIDDKSKADYLAKTLVCVQVTWFVAQIVQRNVGGLPVSLLEFHTLVNIGCALVTYLCWFGKPLGVRRSSMRDAEGFEELLAVMLFRAEVREKEKFEIKSGERLSAPDEVDLWAWTKDGKMEVVKGIALREETIGAFWIGKTRLKRYPDIADGEMHIFPAGKEEAYSERTGKVVENRGPNVAFAAKTGMQPRLRETYESLNTFEFKFSEKDERRVELVRQYIEREGFERMPPKKLPTSWRDFGMDIRSEENGRRLSRDLDLESQTPMVEIPLKTSPIEVSVDETSPDSARDEPISCSQLLCIDKVSPFCISESVEQGHNIRAWDSAFTGMGDGQMSALLATPFIVFTSYGLIHLIPIWSDFGFPTMMEKLLWQVACYILISPFAGLVGFVVIILLGSVVFTCMLCFPRKKKKQGKNEDRRKWEDKIMEPLVRPFMYVGMTILVSYFVALGAARMYLMIEAFVSLRRERVEVFETPEWDWLDYIPHI